METIDPNEEFIVSNYEKTLNIIKSNELHQLHELVTHFGDRYATAPASSRKEYHSAFPGGLCYHNLHVMKWVAKFAQTMAPGKYPLQQLVKVSILHDLGKVGDLKNDYYLPQTSSWHYGKGMFFETNRAMQYMRIPHRSLFLANYFGISLTEEEYLAVMLHDGQFDEANKGYSHKDPDLAIVLHNADLWASRLEKKNTVIGW